MKKTWKWLSSVLTAAMSVTALIASVSAESNATELLDDFYQQYPLVCQNDDLTYYSNFDQPAENGSRSLYFTDNTSYSDIHCYIGMAGCSRDALSGIVNELFDPTYSVSLEMVCYRFQDSTVSNIWCLNIKDAQSRSETEDKADSLFNRLSGYGSVYSYLYRQNIREFTEVAMLNTLCEYDYRSDNELGTGDPETGDKLTSFLAENASDWEVITSGTEQQETFLLRKKNTDFYDVPIAEYLALEKAVQEALGYEAEHVFYPELRCVIENKKVYTEDSGDIIPTNGVYGDVNQDDNVDVKDAQTALMAAAFIMSDLKPELSATGIAYADVDLDGACTIKDAQCILMYYAKTTADLECTWRSLTGNPDAPDESSK